MSINISVPPTHELKPRITVIGVGGAGCNAVNNMIASHLEGVEFVVTNTDAQSLANFLWVLRLSYLYIFVLPTSLVAQEDIDGGENN